MPDTREGEGDDPLHFVESMDRLERFYQLLDRRIAAMKATLVPGCKFTLIVRPPDDWPCLSIVLSEDDICEVSNMLAEHAAVWLRDQSTVGEGTA